MINTELQQRIVAELNGKFGPDSWSLTGSMLGGAFKATLCILGADGREHCRFAVANSYFYKILMENAKGVMEEKTDWERTALVAQVRVLGLVGIEMDVAEGDRGGDSGAGVEEEFEAII